MDLPVAGISPVVLPEELVRILKTDIIKCCLCTGSLYR